MKTITSVRAAQQAASALRREGRRIGLVPTMGALHAGHAALLRRARPLCDTLVVSVFVNPTQFGPTEDLAAYPRTPEHDAAVCAAAGADWLFCPSADEMYPPGHSVFVGEEQLSTGLCGATRPGHFRGVLTVVAKLFHIVQPDVAVFGQKDAQQARLIEQMARDLNFPVAIVVAPTVREADGLAMSSRNAYLSPAERQRATCLYQSLCLAERMYREGTRDAAAICAAMRRLIEATPNARIEYVAVVDHGTLKPVATIAAPALIAVCVRLGRTRLIDNTIVSAGASDRAVPSATAVP